MALVYKGDIGTRLTIATSNTIMALTTVLTVLIRKPSGTLLTKTPTSINYTTGVLTYESLSTDLDEVGEYKVQVRGVFDDGDDLRSDLDSFYVYEKLS